MNECEIWEVLTQLWSDTLKKARLKQAVIDDRMNSFFKGNGCLPSKEDLAEVERCWEQHVAARNKTNAWIAEEIQKNADACEKLELTKQVRNR